MSRCSDQVVSLMRNPRCLVPMQAWYSFIDPLKDERLVNLAQPGNRIPDMWCVTIISGRMLLYQSTLISSQSLDSIKFNKSSKTSQGSGNGRKIQRLYGMLNPLAAHPAIPMCVQDHLIEISTNEEIKPQCLNKHTADSLPKHISTLYPAAWVIVLKLTAFPSFYLVERGFSAVIFLITKQKKQTRN
ncbi:hypothetical protein TNCV_4976011 [Trichonephila clavipes]|uniref:Uncharacterized protein n=1 Tax=Trichonephila clavipes TaxID=2585209 RepID=A0A8X6SF63_TRICX|nr:hypothetical protein TNCV_4976011 [Trichonephila clavipes]